MIQNLIRHLKTGIMLLISLLILTGIIYPIVVTGLAQLFFPWKANGSMMLEHGKVIGSELIGQSFTTANYFWGRPSATTSFPYNAANSMGSNFGPSNPQFLTLVQTRVIALRTMDPAQQLLIPVDLVTASGSGLDPEISPEAAFYQIPRIAMARNISEKSLIMLVKQFIQPRTLGILGEPRVNVLELNIALNNLTAKRINT